MTEEHDPATLQPPPARSRRDVAGPGFGALPATHGRRERTEKNDYNSHPKIIIIIMIITVIMGRIARGRAEPVCFWAAGRARPEREGFK